MRAALSILGLVVVLAIVMMNAGRQAKQLTPPAGAASAPSQADAVRQQLDRTMEQAAQRASDALP